MAGSGLELDFGSVAVDLDLSGRIDGFEAGFDGGGRGLAKGLGAIGAEAGGGGFLQLCAGDRAGKERVDGFLLGGGRDDGLMHSGDIGILDGVEESLGGTFGGGVIPAAMEAAAHDRGKGGWPA